MRRLRKTRIACVWIPHLIVQIERQRHLEPERPLLVSQDGQVLDACSISVQHGVRRKESLSRALARCPQAQVIEADPGRYQEVWQKTLACMVAHSPVIEDARRGVAYLEGWGAGAFYRDEAAWCQIILQEVGQAVDLQMRVGVASSRLASWVVAHTGVTPAGYGLVEGPDRAFLAPQSVGWLPLSAETKRRLEMLGLKTVGQFAALSATAISEQFGPENLRFHAWARGADDGPLRGIRQHVLEVHADLEVPEKCSPTLLRLLQGKAQKTLEEAATHSLTVQRMRLCAQSFVGPMVGSACWVGEALGAKTLLGVLLRLLSDLPPAQGGIIALHLTMTGLEPSIGKQLDLFRDSAERLKMERTLKQMIERYPDGCITKVRSGHPAAYLAADRYKLEAYHP